MLNLTKTLGTLCLIGTATTSFAATIQCKHIPNTPVQQCTSSKAPDLYGLSNMPYTLCSKALCTLSKSGKQARCTCTLYRTKKGWTSLSISPNGYTQAKPTWNKDQRLLTVQSNYSLANMVKNPNQQPVHCHFKKPMPWADCFGARCMVTGSRTATCLCPVYRNKTFGITGPGGQRKCVTKPHQAWSAILLKGMSNNSQFVHNLYYKLYPESPVSKHRKAS